MAFCELSDRVTIQMQVKELVIQNADYVVDSLCRQLRHLELYPQAPSLLAAILRHTGAAPHLLPLLEEPVRHPIWGPLIEESLQSYAKSGRIMRDLFHSA